MTRRVAIVTVHGIDTLSAGYSRDFKRNLLRKLPRGLESRLMFREVLWADLLRGRQRDFLGRCSPYKLKSVSVRRFVIEALGDAAAYQKTTRCENSAYFGIQRRLFEQLKDLEGDHDDPLILMVGHSLGCHVISSFAWDVNRWRHMSDDDVAAIQDPDLRLFASEARRGSGARRLDTFAGFLTLGCNIPLFTFTFGPERVYPITHTPVAGWKPAFPGPSLSDPSSAAARWFNIFSVRDPLGFPIKALNPAYDGDARIIDIPHRVEGWPSMPYLSMRDAHVNYWGNGFVAKKAAELVTTIVRANDGSPAAA